MAPSCQIYVRMPASLGLTECIGVMAATTSDLPTFRAGQVGLSGLRFKASPQARAWTLCPLVFFVSRSPIAQR